MKKNILKSLVLVLGIVTCLGGSAFAAKDVCCKPKPQVTTNDACDFTGHYKLHDEALQEMQNAINIGQKEALSSAGIDFVDLKVEKVDLRIKNGHGKLSLLLNLKTDSNEGFDIYSKTCLVFGISQKDCNTFTFDMITKNCNQSDNCSGSDIKVSREFINGKQYLSFTSKDNELGKMLFEKIK